MPRPHKNIYIWYATTFFSFAAFTLPIWVIFNTDVLGLSNTQAFLLGVMPYGLSALFEVPTGSWADKYGRVKTYQMGVVLYILSVASYIFFSDFYILLLFQVLGGLGLAMHSGCLEALIHDSLGHSEQKDAQYSQIHGRKMAILFISRILTVLTSGWLFSINPRLPFVVAAVTYILGLFVSFSFTEVRIEEPSTNSNYAHIKETLTLMLGKGTLVTFTGLVAVYTVVSESLFALYQPYFRSIHIDIGKFGVFYAVISLFSAIGALSVTKHAKGRNGFSILLAMMFGVLFTLGFMLLKMPALTYFAIIPSSIAFGFVVTLQNTITQKLIGSKHQATAISITSFVRTFAFLVSVVLVGVALDLVTVATLNLWLVVLTVIGIVLFLINKSKKATI